MKRIVPLCLLVLAAAAPGRGEDALCAPPKETVIQSKANCTDTGVAIGVDTEESSAFACLSSKAVQNRCGPDGSLTRLRAFQTWLKKLHETEVACTSRGGTFTYEDPQFAEPTNESFCSQAIPDVSTNMFEDTLCNFHSSCPEVKVRCDRPCTGRVASLPKDYDTQTFDLP